MKKEETRRKGETALGKINTIKNQNKQKRKLEKEEEEKIQEI